MDGFSEAQRRYDAMEDPSMEPDRDLTDEEYFKICKGCEKQVDPDDFKNDLCPTCLANWDCVCAETGGRNCPVHNETIPGVTP